MQMPRMIRSFCASFGVSVRRSSGVAAPAPRLGGITRPREEVFGAVAVEAGPPPVPV